MGYRCAGAYDHDADAVETYTENHGHSAIVTDIGASTPQLNVGRLDVLLAGPPCQGFSTVGRRRSEDPRNSLFARTIELICTWKPSVAVVENVPAIRFSGGHDFWGNAEQRLQEAGYAISTICLDARDLSVPQSRKRLFLFARSNRRHFTLSLPPRRRTSLGAALKGLRGLADHSPEPLPMGSPHAAIAARIEPGQRLCDVRHSPETIHSWEVPEVFGRTNQLERQILMAVLRLRRRDRIRSSGDGDPVSVDRIRNFIGKEVTESVNQLVKKNYLRRIGSKIEMRRTFNGKFRRPTLGGVAPTVDTHFGDPALVLHPTRNRGFTIREAARIQSFPDGFRFTGSKRKCFQLIGNAVPPAMSSLIAAWVHQLRG